MLEKERSEIMLIQFRFKNHKSFYHEAILDMTATLEQRHSDYLIEKNGNKTLPVVEIQGANASGKTTVLDAFFTMAYLVIKSFDMNKTKPFEVNPFIFTDEYRKEDSEFEIFLNIDEKEYRYGFIANREEIKEEWLYEKPFKSNTTAKEKMLFEREKNNVIVEKFADIKDYEPFLDQKTLLLSILGRRRIQIADKIYDWFINGFYAKDFMNIPTSIYELLYNNPDLVEKVERFMSEIDSCVEKIIIEKENKLEKEEYKIYCVHSDPKNRKKKYKMEISLESDGTFKAIALAPFIILSLEDGGTLFIDELDTKFHPLLYRKIVSMFNNPSFNKKHAQLIYSAHSTYLFDKDELRRDQIYLVEKDKNGMSNLYSLSDFENLRGDADYEKKYLAGEFGAIPFQER